MAKPMSPKGKPKKCRECGTEMAITHEDYRYDESGLTNVTVAGIEVRRCLKCGEVEPVIRNIEGLHRAIARGIVEQITRLSGEQVRFLRTYLGWRAVDFAKILGVSKECVSRWENDHEPIGGAADRALRLLVLQQKPVSDYTPERFAEILENIRGEAVARPLRLERRPGGWSEAATAA
jgi:putative zinc finger/helix-turn-helix YgiT family protein